MRPVLSSAAVVTGLMLPSTHARASNGEAVFLGNEAALSGGAVVAWVDDGGAAWYNPAGLASIDRTSVDLSASAFVLRHYVLPDAALTRLPTGPVAADASFTEMVSVPSALTIVRRLAKGVSGALSVYVPHHESPLVKTSYQSDGSVPYQYQWSIAASRTTTRYYAGPAVGWEMAPGLSMGVSAFATYETQATTRNFRSNLVTATSAGPAQAIITFDRRIQSDLFGTAWVLGWRWDISSAWSAGMVLRGPLWHLGGEREIDFGQSGTQLSPGAAPVASYDAATESEMPDTLDQMEPARITLGISRRIASGRVALEGGWQSAAAGGGNVRVPVWNLRAGGAFAVSERFTLGGGLFTDRSPQPPPTALGVSHVDFYGGSLGLQFRSPYEVHGDDEEPAGLIFSTTLAARYAVGLGEIGSLLFDPLQVPVDQPADVTIHELSLHVGSALDF
ncbi:MAG: hypothetical protein JRI23_26590 [Deltaproteobacteria bacterium]|jgi:predicted outer membrane repeat protein|nr:hypothetical protein [Deltaproteobacteria bacterium]MBW2535614.1 hypothetical protein [Deltaproteobacteria bacterium]